MAARIQTRVLTLLRMKGHVLNTSRQPRIEVLGGVTLSVTATTRTGVDIPNRIKRSPTDILEALSTTVGKDPTSMHYQYHDDPYLLPRTALQLRRFKLSKESGVTAADFVFKTYPDLFQRRLADPNIPGYIPGSVELSDEDSESLLIQRIHLRQTDQAVRLFERLTDSGEDVSLDTGNLLLDLLCFYGNHPPDDDLAIEEVDPVADGLKKEAATDDDEHQGPQSRNDRRRATSKTPVWGEGCQAEIIFKSLKSKNSHSYGTLIKGMIKHGAPERAFMFYNEMQSNSITPDVSTYNILIRRVNVIREKYDERCALIQDILAQMSKDGVPPNILTFNSALWVLRKCGLDGKEMAPRLLNEMRYIGIEPSLATYNHMLDIYYRRAVPVNDLVYDIVSVLEGKQMLIRDPDDINFFPTAMKVCMTLRDVQLAYRLYRIVNTGTNYKHLSANHIVSTVFYGKFVELVALMEDGHTLMEVYRNIIPSLYTPAVIGMNAILQNIETSHMFQVLPDIWKDAKTFGFSNKPEFVEEFLRVLVQGQSNHSDDPDLQLKFIQCAVEVKNMLETESSKRFNQMIKWSTSMLEKLMTICCCHPEGLQHNLTLLQLAIDNKSLSPPSHETMSVYIQACVATGDIPLCETVIKMSSECGVIATGQLTDDVISAFPKLTDKQRSQLQSLGDCVSID